jgi:hypothetical protein
VKELRLEGGGPDEAKVQHYFDPFGFGGTHCHFYHYSPDDAEEITFPI